MIAYEFYLRDKEGGDRLIGILPERRKAPKRITESSIMNWAKTVLGRTGASGSVYYVRVNVDEQYGGAKF